MDNSQFSNSSNLNTNLNSGQDLNPTLPPDQTDLHQHNYTPDSKNSKAKLIILSLVIFILLIGVAVFIFSKVSTNLSTTPDNPDSINDDRAQEKTKIDEALGNNPETVNDDQRLVFTAEEQGVPGPYIKRVVFIDFSARTLSLVESREDGCSAIDCDESTLVTPTVSQLKTKLEDTEIKKIHKIADSEAFQMAIDDRSNGHFLASFAFALLHIANDTEVIAKKDTEPGSSSDLWNTFSSSDTNHDGLVTSREFGNIQLDEIIEENL